jgi:hypothetical protein
VEEEESLEPDNDVKALVSNHFSDSQGKQEEENEEEEEENSDLQADV